MGAAHHVRPVIELTVCSMREKSLVLGDERAMLFWFDHLYVSFSHWNFVQVQTVPCQQFK